METDNILDATTAIEAISTIARADVDEIIDALVGVAWDQEEAGRLKYAIQGA